RPTYTQARAGRTRLISRPSLHRRPSPARQRPITLGKRTRPDLRASYVVSYWVARTDRPGTVVSLPVTQCRRSSITDSGRPLGPVDQILSSFAEGFPMRFNRKT